MYRCPNCKELFEEKDIKERWIESPYWTNGVWHSDGYYQYYCPYCKVNISDEYEEGLEYVSDEQAELEAEQ